MSNDIENQLANLLESLLPKVTVDMTVLLLVEMCEEINNLPETNNELWCKIVDAMKNATNPEDIVANYKEYGLPGLSICAYRSACAGLSLYLKHKGMN